MGEEEKDGKQGLRCIVKLGGAAITCKNEIENINEEMLETVSSQLRQVMMTNSSSLKILGMDWSKRYGSLEISVVDNFEAYPSVETRNFLIVHGAGSFGHFQASKSGVQKGGLQVPLVKAGFVATRISVTSLNLEVVRALAREGIPSIGMSPFACGWSTSERNISAGDTSQIVKAIDTGFVPVLHGDAVFDDLLGCTILSGDVIIRHLSELLRPQYVVFLVSTSGVQSKATFSACFPIYCAMKTDVLGVYDRPPADPHAVLLREIAVDDDGSWSIVKPLLPHMNEQVEITVAAHDTTGGMVTKITEAAMIAKLGIDVYIVKAGTDHSLKALMGELNDGIPDDWHGTLIRSSKKIHGIV